MVPSIFPFSEERSAKNYEQAVVADIRKAERIKAKLKELSEALTSNPSLWGGVVSVGWTQMLASTDFPVPVDRVLDAGFSPPDWFLSTGKASAELGSSVAGRWWKDCNSKKEKVEQLLGIPSEKSESLNSDMINRIEKVIRWREVLKQLDEIGVKVFAFTWVADRLMVLEDISCPEAEVEIQKEVWILLEKLLKNEKELLIGTIDKMVSKMREIKETIGRMEVEVADWAEIVRLPW